MAEQGSGAPDRKASGPEPRSATPPRVDDYRDVNRASRDERAPAHGASPRYAVARFAEDPAPLSDVETDRVFATTVTHEWNHGPAEIVSAVLDAGM